jgi:hypothetical protein
MLSFVIGRTYNWGWDSYDSQSHYAERRHGFGRR